MFRRNCLPFGKEKELTSMVSQFRGLVSSFRWRESVHLLRKKAEVFEFRKIAKMCGHQTNRFRDSAHHRTDRKRERLSPTR
ncbi:hypothetical protein TNCT_641911 [Trichonephila clavata]|uniref:Uncharacterized protein n=1 Tax=Trichonephila clavata TaxID=2740835 RepID=A0A8X6JN49_TRICU|nr:hypothetical protein TNCT_641911 [Trichonephila clavata]